MQNQYATQSATLGINADDVRTEELRGREHVVAPATLVREMILKGEMLPFEEIEATQLAWNAKPGTISHPRNDSGDFVPASAPAQYESHKAATLFGVESTSTNRALEGEVWIDREHSARVADELDRDDPAELLLDGETVEVSVGYWYQRFEADGEFDGEEFDAVQVGIQPDHLALLPNAEGECSIENGCGAGRDDASGAAMQRGLLSSPWSALQQASGKLGLNFGAGCAECGGSCDGHNGDDGSTTNNGDGHDTPDDNTMSNRIERLAEESEFDADTLGEMDDAQLDALEDTLDASNDGGSGGDGGSDDPGDPPADDLADQVAGQVLDRVDDRLDEFEREQQAGRRQELQAQIATHTSKDAEDLEDWSTEQLEAFAEEVAPQQGVYAGRAGASNSNDGEDMPMGVSLERLEEAD